MISDSKDKAEILNDQFCSVFSSEDQDQLPEIPGDPAHLIPSLEISLDGVTKLLTNLNSSKAVGSRTKITNQVLKYAANEIAPYLHAIFTVINQRRTTR